MSKKSLSAESDPCSGNRRSLLLSVRHVRLRRSQRSLLVTLASLREKLNELEEARSRLYRRRFFQANIRWKALDEIYNMYMLSHRSDLTTLAKFRQKRLAFSTLEMLSNAPRAARGF